VLAALRGDYGEKARRFMKDFMAKRILVVEDNEDSRLILLLMLKPSDMKPSERPLARLGLRGRSPKNPT
jgi:hypothetical protein